jgi:integrase
MLAAYAGLGRAEIAGLQWDDISDGRVRVRGKGGRVRVVPLLPELAAELTAERARRDASGSGTGYRYRAGLAGPWLFPGTRGGPILPDSLGRAALKALGAAYSVHTLRHRFATRAYAGTRDLLAVQQLLGHSKPETTTRYARASAAALVEAVAAAG